MPMITNHILHSIQKSNGTHLQCTMNTNAGTHRKRGCVCVFKVHSTPESNSTNAGGWTPFDHVQDEEELYRTSRMIETQRGEVEHVSSTPKVADQQDRCQHCHGTGLVICQFCKGTSRVNYLDKKTVPQGEWPMWCTKCIRCTGRTICEFCLGSGKKREPIGFRV